MHFSSHRWKLRAGSEEFRIYGGGSGYFVIYINEVISSMLFLCLSESISLIVG